MFTKSLDSILKVFNKTLSDLDVYIENQYNVADDSLAESIKHKNLHDAAREEAKKAMSIAAKLKHIVNA